MIDIQTNIKCTGRYRAIVHTGHTYDEHGDIIEEGKVLRETPFGKNVITLAGFGRILQNTASNGAMVVGSGNAAPTESDTTLETYLGKTTTVASWVTTRNTVPDEDGYVWWRITGKCTFAPGVLGSTPVNVAECGIAHGSGSSTNGATQVTSRGLLVDEEGDPTTVSVDPTIEFLDIEWEYTEWIKASSTGTVSIDVDGVPIEYDYEVRPEYFDNVGGSFTYGGWANADSLTIPGYNPIGDGTYTWAYVSNVFSGPITAITGKNLGNGVRDNIPTTTSDAYVSSSKQRDFTLTWAPANANIVDGVGVVRVHCGHTCWQVAFSPKLDKTLNKRMSLNWRVSMDNK